MGGRESGAGIGAPDGEQHPGFRRPQLRAGSVTRGPQVGGVDGNSAFEGGEIRGGVEARFVPSRAR